MHAHIGGIDVLARALLIAADMIENDRLQALKDERYAGWNTQFGQDILQGKLSLADLAEHVVNNEIAPKPASGRQEMLENIVNSYIYK